MESDKESDANERGTQPILGPFDGLHCAHLACPSARQPVPSFASFACARSLSRLQWRREEQSPHTTDVQRTRRNGLIAL
jgi:hypothetical protein